MGNSKPPIKNMGNSDPTINEQYGKTTEHFVEIHYVCYNCRKTTEHFVEIHYVCYNSRMTAEHFVEIHHDDNRTLCGDSLCNNYSTCISTSSTKKICIATECSEPVPFLENGIILRQNYNPPSVTFGCQQNYIAVGQGNTTTCTPGGKWSPLSLICEFLGSIRLQSGSSPNEGRVELSINNTWGTICDDAWTETEARVVCQMMGYTGIATPRTAAYFGEGEGPIWLDGVKCSGSESHLLLCEHSPIGSHNCYHF
ncbi:antigen WC1.1-like [Saccostrea cucullata]|uniref:antigen WC1.1-like n=1 Tax=Saccostrea cuccullata TaxID=36930 RepID=UPI002ED30577